MNNLLTIYFLNKKQNNFLIISSLVAIILLLIRVKVTYSMYLLFLIWNLFLAVIPYSISHLIKIDFSLKLYNFKNLLLLITWFLFIPNTFYLITDFVHLHHISTPQLVFDFILFTSFTIAGSYCGILSIFNIYNQILFFHSKKTATIFTILISYLCAFGIYLGRILRFNSWDIISNPFSLINSILKSAFQPETIVFTLILGSVIVSVNLIYFNVKTKKI
jgi:uncharacterized membrane protein